MIFIKKILKSNINYKVSGSAPTVKNFVWTSVKTGLKRPTIPSKESNKDPGKQATVFSVEDKPIISIIRKVRTSMFKCEKHVHCSPLPHIFPKYALRICCIRKTVNHHHHYHHTLPCLWENVWWTQIESGMLGTSFSSTKHTCSFCLSVQNFLAQNKMTIIPHIFTHQTQHCVTYLFSQNPRWH